MPKQPSIIPPDRYNLFFNGLSSGLIQRVSEQPERQWYAKESIINGWSRKALVMQIESNLYQRQGDAVTNFERMLLYA